MLVYRVELPDSTGPWCKSDGKWHGADYPSSPQYVGLSTWSSPCSISTTWPMDERLNWRFGFTNWKQFFDYCYGGRTVNQRRKENKLQALNIIKDKGMTISVYEIATEHIIDDEVSQCVFRIAKATLVERLDSLSDVVMEQLSIYLGEEGKTMI